MAQKVVFSKKITIAEVIRETALEVLSEEALVMSITDLRLRIMEKAGIKSLRGDIFANNFSRDARFSFYHRPGQELSLYLTEVPKRIEVLTAKRQEERMIREERLFRAAS
jgi:hypothetical protein